MKDETQYVNAAGAKAKTAAIVALLSSGYSEIDPTPAETVRVPTQKSPLFGRGGGELRAFGGRARFRLADTDRYVTVGARTTCFYRRNGKDISEMTSIPTHDLDAVRAAIVASGYQANGAPLPVRECAEWVE